MENVAPTADLDNDGPVVEDTTATVTFSNQADPSTADTSAGFRYAYDFNNSGGFEVGDGTYAGSSRRRLGRPFRPSTSPSRAR